MANEDREEVKLTLYAAVSRVAGDVIQGKEVVEAVEAADKALEEYVKLVHHMPMRGDGFARWLKAWRDKYGPDIYHSVYGALDEMLEEYRLRADQGLSLEEDFER